MFLSDIVTTLKVNFFIICIYTEQMFTTSQNLELCTSSSCLTLSFGPEAMLGGYASGILFTCFWLIVPVLTCSSNIFTISEGIYGYSLGTRTATGLCNV